MSIIAATNSDGDKTTFDGALMIEPQDDRAKVWGFDRFDGWLSVYEAEKVVYVSMIISNDPGKGNFSRLLERIWADRYTVKVPEPLPVMEHIVRQKGFIHTVELGMFEVWVKAPEAA